VGPLKVKGLLDIPVLCLWGFGVLVGAQAGLIRTLGLGAGFVAANLAASLFGERAGELFVRIIGAQNAFPAGLISPVGFFLVWCFTFCAVGFFAAGAGKAAGKVPLLGSADALGGAVAGFFLAVLVTIEGGTLLARFSWGRELAEQSYLLGWGRSLWEIAAPWWEEILKFVKGVFR